MTTGIGAPGGPVSSQAGSLNRNMRANSGPSGDGPSNTIESCDGDSPWTGNGNPHGNQVSIRYLNS
jgi:hypothetical protein